jgi:hypothetical protein
MPSLEQRVSRLAWAASAFRVRCAGRLAVCLGCALMAWPQASSAQPPAPPSQREAERQRLLDQLGLKKRPPATANAQGDERDADKKKEEARKQETEKPKGAREEPPAGKGPSDAEKPTTVIAPDASPVIVFSGPLHSALLGACQACHGAGGAAVRSAYVLDGTLDADFTSTRQQVDLAAPEQSPLLLRASGVAHAGGAPLPPTSAGYQRLLRWIRDGAKRGASDAPGAPSLGRPSLRRGGLPRSVAPGVEHGGAFGTCYCPGRARAGTVGLFTERTRGAERGVLRLSPSGRRRGPQRLRPHG